MGIAKITEKDINREFKTRDGRIFRVVKFDGSEPTFPVLALVGDADISFNDENCISLTPSGRYYDDRNYRAEDSENDFAEWVTEQEDDKTEKLNKYKVQMVVIDAKGKTTTRTTVCEELADVDGWVFCHTNRMISLDQPFNGHSVLRWLLEIKGDAIKITRKIDALGANLGEITITVTKVED